MDFKIDFGPWETIFQGKLFNHEVEVIMNPEKYFITIIYDIKEGKKIGALIDGHQALVAKGHMSSFIQTIPKKSIGIIKNTGEKTTKMLFISFNPIYIDFKQEDFVRKIDNEIKKSRDNIETMIELGRTSSLILKETNMVPETDYSPIIGDPFMARTLLSGLKKTLDENDNFTEVNIKKEGIKIPLGLSKNREIIKEEIENLFRTTIIGNNKKEINYTMYILAENFLLENKTLIIFDTNNYFEGLGQSSKNENELKENLIEYEPSGFPIKKYKSKENLKISFDDINFSILFEMMKIKDEKIKKTIIEQKTEYSKPIELIEKIKEMKELNEFEKLKTERILKIIELNYKNFFEKNEEIKEIIKKGQGNLGRATIIDINEMNNEEKIIFINAMLKKISKEIKTKNETNIIIFLPELENFKTGKQNLINSIISLENIGIGFVFGTSKEINELKENNTAKINIVNGKDIALSIKNKRNYRIILRPSLSGEPKI